MDMGHDMWSWAAFPASTTRGSRGVPGRNRGRTTLAVEKRPGMDPKFIWRVIAQFFVSFSRKKTQKSQFSAFSAFSAVKFSLSGRAGVIRIGPGALGIDR